MTAHLCWLANCTQFQRLYVKGRDLYDLFWYLSQPEWPEPNLVLLNNALQQTGWDGELLTLGAGYSGSMWKVWTGNACSPK